MKVLIVEDNPDIRKLLIKQLSAVGHSVLAAKNGNEALRKAFAEPPEIVVTDVLMPEMDGYELCMEWKQTEKLKNIPLVVYTATYTSDEDEQFAMALGVDAFIRKPSGFDTFLAILTEVMEKARAGQLNRPLAKRPEQIRYLSEHNKILLTKLIAKVSQLEEEVKQRRETEKALKESEEKYASLVEHSNDAILIIDKGLIKYANPKLYETMGYSVEEALEKPFDFFVSPEYKDLARSRYARRIAGEKVPSRYELDIVTRDGKSINVEVSTSLITKGDATVEMAIIRDYSERKMAEDALRESEEKFRQFFENAQVYCYIVSSEDIILEVNKAAIRALGYERSELTGQPLNKLYAPESMPRVNDLTAQWKSTGLIDSEELVILTKNGEKRDVLLSIGAITNRDEKMISRVYVQRDITELKQSQMKALEVETLTQLNKAKSELLSNVSHELRTPLASIKGFIETLIEPDVKWSKAQQLEFLIEANKEVDILNLLIKDLLDVSRIESGKMKLEKQLCALQEILESTRSRLTILTSNHILVTNLDPQLPKLVVDKMRIAQVITNLVENATKFSPHGSTITIEARFTDRKVFVSVVDRGIGMSEETVNKLFNRFYQAERIVSGKARGTGLGLSICRGIIEAHGGQIGVKSEPGKGSTFTFSLPV